MRIILFTGKGGVGKTTVACATALKVAASGSKTLIMSTDPAHSVADAFAMEIGHESVEVAPGLWAEQIDPQLRLQENWREIQQHAMAVLEWTGIGEIEAEELSVIPGLDELFSIADVKRHHDEGAFETLIVDCAPTGETLRLLSLPDIIQWYMERIFPVERRVMGALRPVARRMTSIPLPDDNVYSAVRRFYERLEGVRQILTDASTTSVRLVVNPERMVIAEAQRTFTYLNLFGYRVDAVVANRLLPDEVTDPYFRRWKEIHAQHLAEIRSSFDPIPILTAELQNEELAGSAALEDLGREIYGDVNPGEVLYSETPMSVERRGDRYVMSLRIPFAEREDVELSGKGDELFVKVGPYRRTIMLPKALAVRTLAGAQLRDDHLEILFEQRLDG